jgi:hypothetical protein
LILQLCCCFLGVFINFVSFFNGFFGVFVSFFNGFFGFFGAFVSFFNGFFGFFGAFVSFFCAACYAAKEPRSKMASGWSAEDELVNPTMVSLWLTSWSSKRVFLTMTSWSKVKEYILVVCFRYM